jgi:hypothetical protein
LAPTAKHVRFAKKSRLDQKCRGGFWRFATERFFFIEELMTAYGLPHAFHCESDNLLYCALAELLPVFQRHYPGIAATSDNDDRCILGFMYFGSPGAAASLTEYLGVRSAKSPENDMEMIAAHLRASPPSVIDSLPIVPAGFTCSWTTPSGKRSKRPETFSRHAAAFGSVFDAAAIGQYLGGIDPRNTDKPSTVGFINDSCVFDPSVFTYVWKEIAGRRRVPFLRYAGVDHRINNLHVSVANISTLRRRSPPSRPPSP